MDDEDTKPGRYLVGAERDLAIARFLQWWERRQLLEVPEDYPLARFYYQHRAELAKRRAETSGNYLNSKAGARGRVRWKAKKGDV